jgi:hypothetical protein
MSVALVFTYFGPKSINRAGPVRDDKVQATPATS